MLDELLATLDGLSTSGAAVGRVVGPAGAPELGMAVFVPLAAPGETVRVRVTRRQARFLEAELIALEVAAPGRTEPTCPYFGTCGGCDLQHLTYESQLAAKHAMVTSALQKGGITTAVDPIVPSPPFGYRRRLTLQLQGGRVGYFQRRSHTHLPITSCPVAVPELQAWLADDRPRRGEGTITVERSDEGTVVAERNAVGTFSQANAVVNQELVKRIVALGKGGQRACDLYAGAGNFALPLAEAGLTVTAVEVSKRLVNAGRELAEEGGLSEKVRFIASEVATYLNHALPPVDLIVADPPRAGLGKLVSALPEAKTLALISCDLACAVRDLKGLVGEGWTIESITPLDMFAQTAQVELLSILRRAP